MRAYFDNNDRRVGNGSGDGGAYGGDAGMRMGIQTAYHSTRVQQHKARQTRTSKNARRRTTQQGTTNEIRNPQDDFSIATYSHARPLGVRDLAFCDRTTQSRLGSAEIRSRTSQHCARGEDEDEAVRVRDQRAWANAGGTKLFGVGTSQKPGVPALRG